MPETGVFVYMYILVRIYLCMERNKNFLIYLYRIQIFNSNLKVCLTVSLSNNSDTKTFLKVCVK